jgi:hypothetical protein
VYSLTQLTEHFLVTGTLTETTENEVGVPSTSLAMGAPFWPLRCSRDCEES